MNLRKEINQGKYDINEILNDFKNLDKIYVENKYKCGAFYIKKILNENGFDVLTMKEYKDIRINDNILQLWKDGLKVSDISKKINISEDTIYTRLKKCKIDYKKINLDLNTIQPKLDNEEFKIYKDLNIAVSNIGRVWLFESKRFAILSKKDITDKNHGYEYINVNKKHKSIHRMVAELFIDNPNNYKEINHIDMNRENNCVENLEWCTRSHNMRNMLNDFENYNRCLIRVKNNGMKNAKMVKCIEDGKIFNSISEASRFYGINGIESISRICSGQNKYTKLKNGEKLSFEFYEGGINE